MSIQEMRVERINQGRMFVYAVVAVVVLTVCGLFGAVWLMPVAVENRARIEEQGSQPAREYQLDQQRLESERRSRP